MLDIKFVRDNPEAVKENIRKKFQNAKLPLVDEVIALDAEKRAAMNEANDLRAQRNQLSKRVGMLMGQAKKDPSKLAEAEEAKAQVKANADRLAQLEEMEGRLTQQITKIMMVIPQMIDPSVPIGPDDTHNVEVSALASPKPRNSTFPITRRSWSASTALIWTPPAGYPATDSIISWAILHGSTRPCWPMAGTL